VNTRPLSRAAGHLLALLPTAIAVLWVVGVARFREHELSAMEIAGLAAAGFALHAMTRFRRPRPLPPLPAHTSPPALAAMAAGIVAALALLLGGTLEAAIPVAEPSSPWWLRTLWHGACTFGATYCSFLHRLFVALAPKPER
jgi:hypothetical protein